MRKFNDTMRMLREEAGEKQSDVAAKIGVSVQSYSAYETGREPKYETLIKIANHYNCSIDYLLGVSDFKNAEKMDDVIKDIGLKDKAIEKLTKANGKLGNMKFDADRFIGNDYFLSFLKYLTAYWHADDTDYLDKKMGLTFHESIDTDARKVLIKNELEIILLSILSGD